MNSLGIEKWLKVGEEDIFVWSLNVGWIEDRNRIFWNKEGVEKIELSICMKLKKLQCYAQSTIHINFS